MLKKPKYAARVLLLVLVLNAPEYCNWILSSRYVPSIFGILHTRMCSYADISQNAKINIL